MPRGLFYVDTKVLKDTANAVTKGIAQGKAAAMLAMRQAMAQYAEHFLSIAKERAPKDKGDLASRGQVVEQRDETQLTVAFIVGFNIVYAAIRDQGGVIRPVHARALFIPMREGVRPVKGKAAQKASGNKWGVDFVLAGQVVQQGNRYFSSTVDQAKRDAAPKISKRAREIFAELSKRKR